MVCLLELFMGVSVVAQHRKIREGFPQASASLVWVTAEGRLRVGWGAARVASHPVSPPRESRGLESTCGRAPTPPLPDEARERKPGTVQAAGGTFSLFLIISLNKQAKPNHKPWLSP